MTPASALRTDTTGCPGANPGKPSSWRVVDRSLSPTREYSRNSAVKRVHTVWRPKALVGGVAATLGKKTGHRAGVAQSNRLSEHVSSLVHSCLVLRLRREPYSLLHDSRLVY